MQGRVVGSVHKQEQSANHLASTR